MSSLQDLVTAAESTDKKTDTQQNEPPASNDNQLSNLLNSLGPQPTTLPVKFVKRNETWPRKCSKRGCKFFSNTAEEQKQHLDTMHAPKVHVCPYCPYTTNTFYDIQKHIRKHKGEKPYRCPFCAYASAQSSALHKHVKTKHATTLSSRASNFQAPPMDTNALAMLNQQKMFLEFMGQLQLLSPFFWMPKAAMMAQMPPITEGGEQQPQPQWPQLGLNSISNSMSALNSNVAMNSNLPMNTLNATLNSNMSLNPSLANMAMMMNAMTSSSSVPAATTTTSDTPSTTTPTPTPTPSPTDPTVLAKLMNVSIPTTVPQSQGQPTVSQPAAIATQPETTIATQPESIATQPNVQLPTPSPAPAQTQTPAIVNPLIPAQTQSSPLAQSTPLDPVFSTGHNFKL
jgi:hypothetical protein